MSSTERIDQQARVIRSLSVVAVRDYVMDNPTLFPECQGMSEMELTRAIAREHAHNRTMIANEQANVIPAGLWVFPAFLMAGMAITGILMLLGY